MRSNPTVTRSRGSENESNLRKEKEKSQELKTRRSSSAEDGTTGNVSQPLAKVFGQNYFSAQTDRSSFGASPTEGSFIVTGPTSGSGSRIRICNGPCSIGSGMQQFCKGEAQCELSVLCSKLPEITAFTSARVVLLSERQKPEIPHLLRVTSDWRSLLVLEPEPQACTCMGEGWKDVDIEGK